MSKLVQPDEKQPNTDNRSHYISFPKLPEEIEEPSNTNLNAKEMMKQERGQHKEKTALLMFRQAFGNR
jgi:hypothetical protein